MVVFEDAEKQKRLQWIVHYLVEENFPFEHLDALCHIIGLFNDCEEAEKEIFQFARELYKKYAK